MLLPSKMMAKFSHDISLTAWAKDYSIVFQINLFLKYLQTYYGIFML